MKGLLLFLFLIPAICSAQSAATKRKPTSALAPVDKAFGFRDVRLESSISVHPEMQEIVDTPISKKPSGPERFYRRSNENKKIGAASVKSITYYYYKGKLESINIIADSLINSELLFNALEIKYGKGRMMRGSDVNEGDTPAYRWTGRLAEVYFFGYTSSSGKTYLSITSIAQEKKDKADYAKRVKADL